MTAKLIPNADVRAAVETAVATHLVGGIGDHKIDQFHILGLIMTDPIEAESFAAKVTKDLAPSIGHVAPTVVKLDAKRVIAGFLPPPDVLAGRPD